MKPLHSLGVVEIGAAYREGTLTPPRLPRHLLDRIERLDPRVHAFIQVDAEAAGAEFARGARCTGSP